MAFKPPQEGAEHTMIMERKDQLMLAPSGRNVVPTLRIAHFLKRALNPERKTLPQLPPLSLSSNPNIVGLTNRVRFKGRPKPLKTWRIWVENLQQTHQSSWRKVGIFDAIRASTFQIKRHNELIIELGEKWYPETNTFIFSWGESTISLEDVMVLGGFSVLGVSVLSHDSQNSCEFGEIESILADACRDLRRETHNASHYGWMDRFRGKGGELEHLAFLVLWLSRFVFSTNSYNLINPSVFGIAIGLVKGVKFALAPAVLASIYRDLSLLKEKIVGFVKRGIDDGLDLVLWAPFQIVQLWFWERFPMLSPKPASLKFSQPRLARWDNINKLQIGNLMEEIESAGDTFLWRPYAKALKNWEFPEHYGHNERWVCLNSEVRDDILSFAKCLRACELVGMDCLEQYLPHRVGMQFGMDQDVPDSPPRSNGNLNLASISYDMPLDGWKLYLPPRAIDGEVTLQYFNWWKEAIFARHGDLNMMNLSHDRDGNMGGEYKEAPPCSSTPWSLFTKTGMGKSFTEGSAFIGVEGDIGKGKHIALEENHQETQENGGNTFIDCKSKDFELKSSSDSVERCLKAANEAGETPTSDVMIIDDDDNDENNDRVSEFLALVSGIEARFRRLEKNISRLTRS